MPSGRGKIFAITTAVIAVGCLAGCGTINSQAHVRFHSDLKETDEGLEAAIAAEHDKVRRSLEYPDQLVYGGVTNDCALGWRTLTSQDGQAMLSLLLGGPFLLLDLGLCAVSDTLILPLTLSQQTRMRGTLDKS